MTTPTGTLDELEEAIQQVQISVGLCGLCRGVLGFVEAAGADASIIKEATDNLRRNQRSAQTDLESLNEVFANYWLAQQKEVWKE